MIILPKKKDQRNQESQDKGKEEHRVLILL